MGIGDWVLARSTAFRLLMVKFRDHKHDTIESFSRVKAKHKRMDNMLIEHENRLRSLEKDITSVQGIINEASSPIISYKKKKR